MERSQYQPYRIEAVFDPATPVERVYPAYRIVQLPVDVSAATLERAKIAAIRRATGVRVNKHRGGWYGRTRQRNGGAQSFRLYPVEGVQA